MNHEGCGRLLSGVEREEEGRKLSYVGRLLGPIAKLDHILSL